MMAGGDTVLTLCDGTDRGFISFEDADIVQDRLQTEQLTIACTCFNNGQSVTLRVRYELGGDGLMLEHAARQDRTPVSTIVLHRVSRE